MIIACSTSKNDINSLKSSPNKALSFGLLDSKKNDKAYRNSSYIKHKIHEKKIDDFFWTNIEAPHERFSALALIGAFVGVMIPAFLLGRHHNPHMAIDSIQNFFKVLNFHYGVKEIIATGVGGAIGGLLGGLADKNEKNKLNKIQEANYQVMNISFPALMVGGAVDLCEKSKSLNNPYAKIAASAVAMVAGAFSAVKLANKVDNKIFDKYNIEPDRKFKAKDFVVHVDDIIGSLILAKVPFANKLHPEKLLPAIFTWSGFHVGES